MSRYEVAAIGLGILFVCFLVTVFFSKPEREWVDPETGVVWIKVIRADGNHEMWIRKDSYKGDM